MQIVAKRTTGSIMATWMTQSRYVLTALLLAALWIGLSTVVVHAQEVDRMISFHGSNSSDYVDAVDMAMDDNDNLYLVGNFWGTINIDSPSLSGSGTYFAKYDAAGNLLWTRVVSGLHDVSSIDVDSSGQIYITGSFRNPVNFGTVTFTPTNTFIDSFIAKYDTDGNFVWAKHLRGTQSNFFSRAINVDSGGNIYVGGSFTNEVYFGTTTLTNLGAADTFLARYDTDGNFIWVQQLGGGELISPYAVAESNGNVYITGHFEGSATIGAATLTSTGSDEIFLAAFANDGTFSWARQAGGTSTDRSYDVVVDQGGNLYITGYSEGAIDFGSGFSFNPGRAGGYVAKYDSAGTPIWVELFLGIAIGEKIDIDNGDNGGNAGNVYVSGTHYDGEINYGALTIHHEISGLFVAALNANGDTQWVREATTYEGIFGKALTVDSNGFVHVAGDASRHLLFGSFMEFTNEADIVFIARLAPTAPSDFIFQDGFESGDFSAWTNYSSDFGDLDISSAADGRIIVGDRTLRVRIDDNVPIGVRDEVPNGEDRYQARFFFLPNSIVMGEDENHVIFFGYSGDDLRRPVLRLELRYHAGSYQLRAALFDDGTTWRTGNWQNITNERHLIALDWYAATGDGDNNGSLRLWTEDGLISIVTGVDNDTRRIDTTRLGSIAGIDNGTRGTIFFDRFESHRLTYIEPTLEVTGEFTAAIASPAIADPTTIFTWTDVDESAPEEAALMREVLAYAEQVEREEAETPPSEEEQTPQLFLPYVNHE